MSAIEDLITNIDSLTQTITDMGSKSFPADPISTAVDQEGFFLTDRQIMKKVMLGRLKGVSVPEGIEVPPGSDEETVHLYVYGKALPYSSGETLEPNPSISSDGIYIDNEKNYPECLDKSKAATEDSPLKMWAKETKNTVKTSIKQLSIKVAEISMGITQTGAEVGVSVAAFVDAMTIIPKPAPSLALSSLLLIFSSIMKLQAKVMEILPFIAPLALIGFLLPDNKVEQTVGTLNGFLGTINSILAGVSAFSAPMDALRGLIGNAKEEAQKKAEQEALENSGTTIGTSGIPTFRGDINSVSTQNQIPIHDDSEISGLILDDDGKPIIITGTTTPSGTSGGGNPHHPPPSGGGGDVNTGW